MIFQIMSFTVGFVSDSNTTVRAAPLVAFRGLISKSIVNWAQLGTKEMLTLPAPNSMKRHFPPGKNKHWLCKRVTLMTNWNVCV